MLGFDCDRQRPINKFVAAFYCKDLRRVIEVDGESHDYDDAYEADLKRQQKLKSLDVRFLTR